MQQTTVRYARRAAALAALTVLAIGAARAAPAPAVVSIDNFTFTPMEVTIPAGGAVTWSNTDDVPHTVRAADSSFHSPPMDTGEHFSFTFTKPGVYSYFCSIHPRMVGKVIVR